MALNGFISRRRLAVLTVIGSLAVMLVVVSYARQMLVPRETEPESRVPVERGSILDRNGKILAIQTTLYNIAVTRSAIKDKAQCAAILAPVTGMNESEILERLSDPAGGFFYLKKKISEGEKTSVAETIKNAHIRGIRLEPVTSRTYPENQLASHVVGFLGDDGAGLTGAENTFQDLL